MNVKIVSYKSVEYYQALALRDLVLRAPLGLIFSTQDLQSEEECIHFVVELDDVIIATAQMVDLANSSFKMRQVAVHPNFQGLGYGRLFHFTGKIHRSWNSPLFHGKTHFVLIICVFCESLHAVHLECLIL